MNKIMSDEKIEIVETNEAVPLHLRVLPRTPAFYVQHLAVSPTSDEVILSFFEVQPPLDHSPEALEQLKKTGLIADCVARIAVTPQRFVEFARLMSEMAKVYPNSPNNRRIE